ncbi:MAG: HAMP domain-containing histidine kinase [Oscillospiraceae bacterium]|jgi:signal transduction histidine kinase|nr:HAMP domain-containing histidine kinase [Oscillospiraceae bacterium]
MKNHILFGGLLVLFLLELAVLVLFALPQEERAQDTVAVNEAVKTVQSDWSSFEGHVNRTSLDYVVIDASGTVLYKTRAGLSESINAAIGHKDTILDVESGGMAVGKILIYNDGARIFEEKKRTTAFVLMAAAILQFCLCAGYLFYIRRAVIKPFDSMKDFARRIAGGNLDIPLEMDRQNLFGAFTESFDLMRSELKRARIAEARANADKKELVAKLSHDIKTPVASIKAASEVGAALASDEKSRETYGRIIQKADQINTLVTNLFSATLEELQELSVTPSDMKSNELQSLLENADYLRRAVIPPVPGCMLSGDRLRLQQVFDNLFVNSYKYAGTEITVFISMEDGYLTVTLEDWGGGVSEEELPLLKEKFKRGSNAKNIEGAGLGLYISDYCMRKMAGRLEIANGKTGLRATVWIPLSDAARDLRDI